MECRLRMEHPACNRGGHGDGHSSGYTDNFTDGVNHNAKAYVTQVTLPTTDGVSHVAKKQYFYNTGLVAASCGENSNGACTNSATPPQPDYTTFTYERLGRPRVVTSGDGGQSSTCYSDDPDGPCYSTNPQLSQTQTQTITAGVNKVTVSLLDGVGSVVQTQLTSDPEGTVYVETTYDGIGRTKTVTNPHRATSSSTDGTTTYNYNGFNRTVVNPDGTSTTTTYAGNTVTVTDEAGKQRKNQTDALGRLVAVWEAPNVTGYNYETDYQYDLLDNLLCAVQKGTDTSAFTSCGAAPPSWRPRSFTYDSLSRLLTANNPETGTVPVQYSYNNDSVLVSKTDARGITINYNPSESQIDALHRVTKKTHSNGDPAVSYFYDQASYNGLTIANGKGRRTGMSDESGATAWSFDVMGRALAIRETISGQTKTISTTYNLDGSTATVTYPNGSGSVLAYTYNSAGRLTLVQDTAHSITYMQNTSYTPPGQLTVAKYSSVKETTIFNSRLQPCWMYATTGTLLPSSTPCNGSVATANVLDRKYNFGLGVDDNGTVRSITNRQDSNRSVSYTYDALNRLASAATPNTDCTTLPFNITRNWGENITIDPWGNLSNRTVTKCQADPLSVVPLNNNRLSGFGYDAAGNMTSNGGSSYTYNAETQLKTAGGVTYTYDGDGNRVKKSSGTLYWGGGPLAESNLSGALQREYIFANGRRIARRDIGTGQVLLYFTDHLGSTSVVTNPSGAIQNDSDYFPYGGERVYTQTISNQNYKFTGKERDSESGLDNFGARYDSSSLGRFMTPDWAARPTAVPYAVFGDPQSLSLYGYVRNDPVSLADADGHTCEENGTQSLECLGRSRNPGGKGSSHSGPGSLINYMIASMMSGASGLMAQNAWLEGDAYNKFEIGSPSDEAEASVPPLLRHLVKPKKKKKVAVPPNPVLFPPGDGKPYPADYAGWWAKDWLLGSMPGE